MSPDCTNGHTAKRDKSVGHSDILDDSEFGTCVLVVVTGYDIVHQEHSQGWRTRGYPSIKV